ncbi:MAG: hypothetical protein HY459_00325 [Parcubacteria group bacterium]|nr:hypothetical protein [Parcubacteria group bacterium]
MLEVKNGGISDNLPADLKHAFGGDDGYDDYCSCHGGLGYFISTIWFPEGGKVSREVEILLGILCFAGAAVLGFFEWRRQKREKIKEKKKDLIDRARS